MVVSLSVLLLKFRSEGGDPVGDAGALAFTRVSGRAARALF